MTRILKFAPEPHTPTDRTGASGAASPATRNSRPDLLALRDAFALVIAYQSNSKRNDPVRDWLNTEFWRIHFAAEGF